MSSPSPIQPHRRQGQRGMALITTLILLVMMMVIALSAARMGSLEERMAGNMRDRDIALRAAEMTLRDAERDVLNAVPAYDRNIIGCTGFLADCGSGTTASDADDGLCYSPSGYATPIWQTKSMTAAPSVPYGRWTTPQTGGASATPIPGVSAQPRYLIECMRKTAGGNRTFYYQLTVRAQGQSATTVVWLQEVFSPQY